MADACEAAVEAFTATLDGDLGAALLSAVGAFAAASWRPMIEAPRKHGAQYLVECGNSLGLFEGYYVVTWSDSKSAWCVSTGKQYAPVDFPPIRFIPLARDPDIPAHAFAPALILRG